MLSKQGKVQKDNDHPNRTVGGCQEGITNWGYLGARGWHPSSDHCLGHSRACPADPAASQTLLVRCLKVTSILASKIDLATHLSFITYQQCHLMPPVISTHSLSLRHHSIPKIPSWLLLPFSSAPLPTVHCSQGREPQCSPDFMKSLTNSLSSLSWPHTLSWPPRPCLLQPYLSSYPIFLILPASTGPLPRLFIPHIFPPLFPLLLATPTTSSDLKPMATASTGRIVSTRHLIVALNSPTKHL